MLQCAYRNTTLTQISVCVLSTYGCSWPNMMTLSKWRPVPSLASEAPLKDLKALKARSPMDSSSIGKNTYFSDKIVPPMVMIVIATKANRRLHKKDGMCRKCETSQVC